VYRRNILGSKLTSGNEGDLGNCGKFGEEVSDIIQQAREEYGRYFGICSSYHNLKACICKDCPSYSGGAGMFCSRSKSQEQVKKQGCLCETCELFKKLQFEGEYFCLQVEKQESSEEKSEFYLKNCKKASECTRKTRFCVVESK
jgi:Protein of unknown function (DUF2769).